MGKRLQLVAITALVTVAGQSVVSIDAAVAAAKPVKAKTVKAKPVKPKTVTSKPVTTTSVTTTSLAPVKVKQFGPNTTNVTPFASVANVYGEFLQRVGADLDAFWTAELPFTFGQGFNGLFGFFPYSRQTLPPNCGRVRVPSYRVVQGNAFYCRDSDYIAFDNDGLFPEVYSEYGASALGVILAHEYGHAIQARTGLSLSGALNETQADCFSGAWLKRVTTGGSPTVSIPMGDLDTILQAMLTFRDTPGTGGTSLGAHGTGFDRVAGLQLGYDFGASRCAAFATNPPTLVAKGFEDQERANRGNVPYAEALEIAIRTTAQHFVASFPALTATVVTATDPDTVLASTASCPGGVTVFGDLLGVCPGDTVTLPTIVYSRERMQRVYSRLGDAAVGYVHALGWATLASVRQGRETAKSSPIGETRTICLAASWYRWFGVDARETLSSGDIDEGIFTVLSLQGASSSFDRVRALRVGFESGINACS